jgi:nitroreductase/NAD-dependent dihydropyrimidine dehydrogenase PreA subunit
MDVLEMGLRLGSGCTPVDESVPTAKHPDKCIRCGHCVAVCPKGALDHGAAPLSKQIEIDENARLDPETAAVFLRSRRSVRLYEELPIPKEKLRRLLDIARFAPSGTNTQGLSYLVISDRERLARVTKVTIDWLEERLTRPGSKMPAAFWEPVRQYREGKDGLLRGAPHLIVALCPPEILAVSTDSAKFALEYIELLAPTMGIGTCFMGLVQLFAGRKHPPLTEALGAPADKEIVGILAAGLSKIRYRRLVDRNPPEVLWL